MRAYHKGTLHPYCIYLTKEEAEALVEEAIGVDPEYTPWWYEVSEKVEALLNNPERKQA